ncbi:choline kinase [Spirochaetia bacterium]|nr:choline kinase [Spirochaetia bacterium]
MDNFKVNNAIILAAGFGSRFIPLTYEIPKSLIKVHGKPMIERQIEQLLEKGITEIIVVVGHMKEKFNYLIDKYGVTLIYNPEFAIKNNLSSLYCVLPYLCSSYLLMADNWIEKNIFNEYETRSWFSCIYFRGETDEWCVTVDENDKIESISIGGQDAYAVVGPAYFSPSFSAKFSKYVKDYYNKPESYDYYWEHILKNEINSLPMYMNKQTDNVHEFDSLQELKEYDASYMQETGSRVMQHIAKELHVAQGEIEVTDIANFFEKIRKNISFTLKCKKNDIGHFQVVHGGYINLTLKFTYGGNDYIYRQPGYDTERFINRISEAYSNNIGSALGIDKSFIYMCPEEGWKISRYIADARILDYHNEKDVEAALGIMKTLHTCDKKTKHDFIVWKESVSVYENIKNFGCDMFTDFEILFVKMKKLSAYIDADKNPLVLCHGDCWAPNYLITNEQVNIIDWEFSGNSDPGYDLGTFICCSDYTVAEALAVIDQYFNGHATSAQRRHMIANVALASYFWFVYGIYMKTQGMDVGDFLDLWHVNIGLYAEQAFPLYEGGSK